MIADHHVLIWARVFEWIYPGWSNQEFVQEYLQHFPPMVHCDKVYTTLGSLGQIIWDLVQLPLDHIILAASYVSPDLIELIKHVYDVYHNLCQHLDIDEDLP